MSAPLTSRRVFRIENTHRTSLLMSGAVWIRRYATAGSAKLSSLPHQGYKCNCSIVGFRYPWFPGPQPEVTFIFRQHNSYVFLPARSPSQLRLLDDVRQRLHEI